MLEIIKRIFKRNQSSIPDQKTQVNIGNLAVYHLDKALTRIEVLAGTGKISVALSEYNVLQRYFEKRTNPESSIEYQNYQPASIELELAIEYIEKLYSLLDSLLKAERVTEALALKVYLDEIDKRLKKHGERSQSLAKRIKKKV
jgi:hypothetical protein